MENVLGEFDLVSRIYEKWMSWNPPINSWLSFISFEKRRKNWTKVRELHHWLAQSHPDVKNFIKLAKFEFRQGRIEKAWFVFEKTFSELKEKCYWQSFFIAWAEFETKVGEIERAKLIYWKGLSLLTKYNDQLFQSWQNFQLQYSEGEAIDQDIFLQSKLKYQNQLNDTPLDIDLWFNFFQLLEQMGEFEELERQAGNLLN